MTESELKKMTVKQLKEYASEHTKLSGMSGMKKDALVSAIIDELGIDEPGKELSKVEKKKGLNDKGAIKIEILRLKQKKSELQEQDVNNSNQFRNIRRRIRNLKRKIQKVS